MIVQPNPWYVDTMSAHTFMLGMLSLGTPLEISYVGAFEDAATTGRGSRRDMDLPLHRDGVYSEELAKAQGGHYVERPNVDFVGLYCLRDGWAKVDHPRPCLTIIKDVATDQADEIELRYGTALIFDNNRVLHGRRGPIGDRVLLRVWIQGKGITDPFPTEFGPANGLVP